MTQQPQQEYIITEEQLKKYEGLFFLDDNAQEDFKTIRSRPHTSSTGASEFTSHNPCNAQPNTYRCCEVCPNVLSKPVFRVNCLQPQHDTAIHNATLDSFIDNIEDKLPRYPSDLGDMYLLSDIQSLRSTKEQP